jgi:hypothetical protein
MPFLVQIEQLHSPTVDCSGSTRTRNRTRPQWQPHLYVCSLPCPRGAPVISGRGYSFWGSPTYLRFFSWPDRFHQPGARQTEVAPWAHPRQRAGTEGYVTEALSEPRGALRASRSSARRSKRKARSSSSCRAPSKRNWCASSRSLRAISLQCSLSDCAVLDLRFSMENELLPASSLI